MSTPLFSGFSEILHNQAGPIGVQKILQIPDRLRDSFAVVRVRHGLAAIHMLDQNRIGVDVRPLHDRLLHRLEWFVGGQHQAVGIVDQRVAGDAGFRLVCPGKSSVDDQQFASALDRGLPAFASTGIWPLMM